MRVPYTGCGSGPDCWQIFHCVAENLVENRMCLSNTCFYPALFTCQYSDNFVYMIIIIIIHIVLYLVELSLSVIQTLLGHFLH